MPFEIIKNYDLAAIEFSAKYAHQSELFDKFFVGTLGRPTFKFLPLIAILWFIWFDEKNKDKNRLIVICTFLSGSFAIVLSRTIQNIFSEKLRPMHDKSLTQFVAPFGADKDIITKEWSSFPSDHAAIAFAILAGLFVYNKILGFISLVFIVIAICAPRIYSGYHYASDIVGGALVGLFCAFFTFMLKDKIKNSLFHFVNYIEKEYRAVFYGFSFILSYQVVTMFNDIRWPLMSLIDLLNR